MIPFVLIGGGLYLVFDALGNQRKSFDPADFGLPTKGFRGYRKGAAHFAKGGEISPKFKEFDRVRDIKGNYGYSSGYIASVVPPKSNSDEFQYWVSFDGERDEEHPVFESELVSDEPKASMNRRDRYGFFAKGSEVPEVGQRVELIRMYDDPKPVEPGTKGTVKHIGGDVINVDWDNGRSLGLVMGVDEFKVIEK